jgi:hypothetical protein
MLDPSSLEARFDNFRLVGNRPQRLGSGCLKSRLQSLFDDAAWDAMVTRGGFRVRSLVASYDFLLYTIKSFGRCRFSVSRTGGRKGRRLFGWSFQFAQE